jgi:hypothetical protein
MCDTLKGFAIILMATYKDPDECFAPLEVVERLLEIREEFGFSQTLYLPRVAELTNILDSFGFDMYSFATENEAINYGDYRCPIVPGGDVHHSSVVGH